MSAGSASEAAPPAAHRGERRRSDRSLWVSTGALPLGMLLAAPNQTIVATAPPVIAGWLGCLNHLSWVVTAYLFAATAGTPLWGKPGDRYGRERLFQTAVSIFLFGSALCGAAQSMGELTSSARCRGRAAAD